MYYCLSDRCLKLAGLRPNNTKGVKKDSKTSKCSECGQEMRFGEKVRNHAVNKKVREYKKVYLAI